MEKVGLVDAFKFLHPLKPRPQTWIKNPDKDDTQSACLDYSLVSGELARAGALVAAGCLTHDKITGDHRITGVELNLTPTLGTSPSRADDLKLRPRTFKYIKDRLLLSVAIVL